MLNVENYRMDLYNKIVMLLLRSRVSSLQKSAKIK